MGYDLLRQSGPFDVLKAVDAAQSGELGLPEVAPLGWPNLLILGTFFIMREIEIAFALTAHVTIGHSPPKVTILLPVSKKDPRAVGCERSWACLCIDDDRRRDCRFHAAVAQLELLRDVFGELPADLPLFPTKAGTHADKSVITTCLEKTVEAYGGAVAGPTGKRLLGGHSFRVSGAQRLASIGVEVVKIAILARWSSNVVLRYVREAPLDNIADEVKALESKRDLLRHIKMLCNGAAALDTKLGNLEAQLQQLALDRNKQFQEWLAKAKVSPLPFVSNAALREPKLHKVLVDGADVLPSLWRTRCGKRFGFWQLTRLADCSDVPAEQKCKNCFKQDAHDSSTSSSESSSGS